MRAAELVVACLGAAVLAAVLVVLAGSPSPGSAGPAPAPAEEDKDADERLPDGPTGGRRLLALAPRPEEPPAATPSRAEGRPPVPRAARPTGRLVTVRGSAPASDDDPARTFFVEVERGLPVDKGRFARFVQSVLYDERGWAAAGGFALQWVDSGTPDFRVALASPDTTDSLCAPLDTAGIYSCHNEGRAVLNYWRWANGADAYGDHLTAYRTYMVNHEVGHALGHGHAFCTEAGAEAPLMMQQTKGVGACEPHPWPLRSEKS